ncbi:MAG TPA: hypothetical protein VN976_14090 [Verrucomicrobiae bacterium]|nr:hypothetical protein [Verrucomicrobiae bacterium]
MLVNQFQPGEILFSPTGLNFDDAFECAEAKRIGGMVEGQGNAAAIGMTIVPVTTLLPLQLKTICE